MSRDDGYHVPPAHPRLGQKMALVQRRVCASSSLTYAGGAIVNFSRKNDVYGKEGYVDTVTLLFCMLRSVKRAVIYTMLTGKWV